MRRDLISTLFCIMFRSNSHDLGMSQGAESPPMSSLPPNPCTASHVESAVSQPQPPLWQRHAPQRARGPHLLTLYVSPAPSSSNMSQSIHCCVEAGWQPAQREPGSCGEDDPPDGCLDYTQFGTTIRVYFVNHPGDTLTLDDAQWCLNTALYDYRGCSRSRGRLGSSGSWRRAGVPNNFAWEVPTFSTEAPCVVSGVACAPMLSFCRGLV